jgi:hypothetical protein
MSNYVKTTNFLRKDSLPDTDTDKIIRGSEFDTEFNNLVTAVASKANIVSPEFTGVPRAPTAAAGTSTTQLATTAFVAQNAILRGMIVMWSGEIATIPTGYALCDGTNDTPNLTDRFIMSAGSTYTPGDTGGSANTVNVSHNHTVSGATSSSGAHTHAIQQSGRENGEPRKSLRISSSTDGYSFAGNAGNYISTEGAHTHTWSGTTTTKGESGAGKNIPPYYALAFIMKT